MTNLSIGAAIEVHNEFSKAVYGDALEFEIQYFLKRTIPEAFVRRPRAAKALAEEANGYMKARQVLSVFRRLHPYGHWDRPESFRDCILPHPVPIIIGAENGSSDPPAGGRDR